MLIARRQAAAAYFLAAADLTTARHRALRDLTCFVLCRYSQSCMKTDEGGTQEVESILVYSCVGIS